MPSNAPFPLMPAKSTELRMEHFDENVYIADSSTLLYKFMDALCGDSGAGSLKKEIFIQRLSGAINGIYGSDLDFIFGNVSFLSRAPSESYTYDTSVQMLTSEQWDEVATKDAWYRARIVEYFQACTAGGTHQGVRLAVHAAVSTDCEIFENWRYLDNFGYSGSVLGRSGARNEIVVKPLKSALEPKERRLLRDMLDRITPQDSITTIDTNGLSVSTPVPVRAVVADSVYYEVQKVVTGTPVLEDLPTPELLAIDLDPTEKWLFSRSPELAPYAQFNITSEYGYYYLIGGGNRSPIDSVNYSVIRDGVQKTEAPFELYESTGQFTGYIEYEIADSPDNYPGGKFGLNPTVAPPINPDGSPYQFPWVSQQALINAKKAEVLTAGGYADDQRYRLPMERASSSKRTFTADLAIAYSAPARDSTVTSSWTSRKPRTTHTEIRNGNAFVRA